MSSEIRDHLAELRRYYEQIGDAPSPEDPMVLMTRIADVVRENLRKKQQESKGNAQSG